MIEGERHEEDKEMEEDKEQTGMEAHSEVEPEGEGDFKKPKEVQSRKRGR